MWEGAGSPWPHLCKLTSPAFGNGEAACSHTAAHQTLHTVTSCGHFSKLHLLAVRERETDFENQCRHLMSFTNSLNIGFFFLLKMDLWNLTLDYEEKLKWHIMKVNYLPAPAEHSARLCCCKIVENKSCQEFDRSSKWCLCQGRWVRPQSSLMLSVPICVLWDSHTIPWLVILPWCFLFLQQYDMPSNDNLLIT